MVKGISKQVIVVPSPDPHLFEQAIFILREEAADKGVSAQEVVQEARRVADGYLRRSVRPASFFSRIPAPLYALGGALLASAAWALALFFL